MNEELLWARALCREGLAGGIVSAGGKFRRQVSTASLGDKFGPPTVSADDKSDRKSSADPSISWRYNTPTRITRSLAAWFFIAILNSWITPAYSRG
jgi:hypothetical protein